MSNTRKTKQDPNLPTGLNRVSAEVFIEKLSSANTWMVWVNPAFEEVELIIRNADDSMSVFHGPDPMSMGFPEYKDFCRQVDIISDAKE